MATRLQWASSEGGPLILLSATSLREWEGIDIPADGRRVEAEFRWHGDKNAPASDYDRACDIADYIGVISVGLGQGLVLGDEPNSTCWLPHGPSAGTLVRVVCELEDADDEATAQIVSGAPEDVFTSEPFTFSATNSLLYLFDSALPGRLVDGGLAAGEAVEINLTPGEYRIETAHYRPSSEVWLDLHRLTQITLSEEDVAALRGIFRKDP